jgi:hypothetical protein
MKQRKWLRFSLRTLLVVLTIFAIWIGFEANRANQQRQAVQRILAVGGSITYQHEVDAKGNPNETHSFNIVLHLKSPDTRQIPGSLHVNFNGVDIVETPLSALKPQSEYQQSKNQ